jgi:carboxyl-terminal processing protease
MRRRFLWLVFFIVPLLCAADAKPLRPADRDTVTAHRFAQVFSREHLTHHPLDDEISRRAWTNYLTALDFEHAVFMQADIDRLRADETALDDALQDGDLDFAYRAFTLFLERLTNRCAYAVALLDKGFDVTQDESYLWKRKDAPWPVDDAAWDELWRKKVKNEYVQRVLAMERREAARQAATNQPPPAVATTNAPETASDRDSRLSPQAFIRKQYEQLRTVLLDSDSEWVLQRYLTAFAQAYDPHSGYMSPASVEDFDIEMKLSLVGIGTLLRSEDGAAKIEQIIPGGPADRDKRDIRLRPGDKIVGVAQGDGESQNILHWPLSKVVKLIRGKKGTRVVLTVIPVSDPSGMTTRAVDLVRDEVKLEAQEAKGRIVEAAGGDGVRRKLGVITLPAFYANMKVTSARAADYKSSADDVRRAMLDALAKGAEGVLLDLRNNGGGSLIEAVKMVGLFIVTGPVVQVKEGAGPVRILTDDDPSAAYDGPLVVLVDRRSASASEIVAGALQDYGRAVVVGDSKTHGKGTVQSVVELRRGDPNFGSLKVTTAKYYRISGGSTQLRGVVPDIVVSSPFDRMEIGEEYLPNAVAWSQVKLGAYTPSAAIAPLVATLTEKSLRRRAADPRFKVYDQLLARIDQWIKAKALPLNLAERKKLADTEKELTDLESQLDAERAEENDRGARPDLVLSEALAVLADMIGAAPAAPPPPPPEKTWWDAMGEWFHGGL